MIRKWSGRIAAAAIVALLVFAVLHRGQYRSLLFGDKTETAAPEHEAARDGVSGSEAAADASAAGDDAR